MLPVSQIKPTVEETWAGIKAMCMEIKPEFVSGSTDFDQSNAWDQNEIFDQNNVIQSFP